MHLLITKTCTVSIPKPSKFSIGAQSSVPISTTTLLALENSQYPKTWLDCCLLPIFTVFKSWFDSFVCLKLLTVQSIFCNRKRSMTQNPKTVKLCTRMLPLLPVIAGNPGDNNLLFVPTHRGNLQDLRSNWHRGFVCGKLQYSRGNTQSIRGLLNVRIFLKGVRREYMDQSQWNPLV